MRSLLEIHATKQGKVSDKWEAYFPVYERVLSPVRTESITLLEIGVQNGGSLETWAEYFNSATHIVGCDINPSCGNLSFSDSRIHLVVGDCGLKEAEEQISEFCPSFDIIIDDGSHMSGDILRTFWIYFQRVAPGGVYVIEDTHTLYWEPYEGGILKRNSAQELFKLIADIVNYEHWKNEVSLHALLATFFPRNLVPTFIIEGWIESIEFSNSMIVIRKAVKQGSRLGRRLISGTLASVNDDVIRLRESLSDAGKGGYLGSAKRVPLDQ